MDEGDLARPCNVAIWRFQSAGRIIGWMKRRAYKANKQSDGFQSAGRIIGGMKVTVVDMLERNLFVSIRRADYWLDEAHRATPR